MANTKRAPEARIFSIIFSFIDDLCINNNKFENNYKYIYPDELVLNRTLFIDPSIEIYDRKFTTNLFDKIYAFSFFINCMSYVDSSIPSKIFCTSKSGSECTHSIWSLRKMFRKHFKLFHKFADTVDEFIKRFSFLTIFVYVYIIFRYIIIYI